MEPLSRSLETDRGKLRQILVNLIGNAIKYTDEGSIVVKTRLVSKDASLAQELLNSTVASTGDGKSLLSIQVIDSGVGIAPADHERVFEEFEQVAAGPRADSPHRGTGLGLAISRRLARLLGGDVSVVSEFGRGSTFSLWLPIRDYDLAISPQYTTDPG